MTQDPAAPRRSGLGCFWKSFITIVVVLVSIVLLFALQAHRIKSWVDNGAENAPAAFPTPKLSAEEQRHIDDLYRNYEQNYIHKKDLDILLSTDQFNQMVAENIARQKARGNPVQMEALQVSFDGPKTVFRGSAPVPDQPGMFFNFEFSGTFAIENQKASWQVDNIRLHGQDGPMGTVAILQGLLRKGFEEQEQRHAQGQDSIFRRIKLLRREGDKIHAILNGEYLEAPQK